MVGLWYRDGNSVVGGGGGNDISGNSDGVFCLVMLVFYLVNIV